MSSRIIYIVSFVAIVLSIYTNVFGFNHMKRFTPGMEAWCISRLALSEQKGIFSEGGFIGWIEPRSSQIDNGNLAYFENRPIKEYSPYKSYSAIQTTVLSLLDSFLSFDKKKRVSLYYFLICFVSAISYFLIFKIVYDRLGFIASLIFMILLLNSEWLLIASYQMSWVFGFFFIPPILSFYYIQPSGFLYKQFGKYSVLLFAAISLKIMTSGYTFITSFLMCTFIPFVCETVFTSNYSVRAIKRYVKVACASGIAVIFSSILLIFQQASYFGDFTQSMLYLRQKFIARTGRLYVEEINNPKIIESLNYDFGHVLSIYFDKTAFMVNSEIIPFKYVFFSILMAAMLQLCFVVKKRLNQQIFLGALAGLIYSFVCSVSWFYIFLSHSYLHHFDFVVWYLGFLIVGYIVIGYSISIVLKWSIGLFKPHNLRLIERLNN